MSDGAHAHDLVEHPPPRSVVAETRLVQVVDFWHLVKKLAAAAPLLNGDASKRFSNWRKRLLNEENAATAILLELKDSGREHTRVGDNASRPRRDHVHREPPRA
jgi:hypothetical protein